MLNALNEVLRDDFIKDSVAGVGRWNKVLEKAGIPHAPGRAAQGLQPQDRRARRHQDVARRPRRERGGMEGARRASGCRRPADFAFVASLMGRVRRARQVRRLDRAAGDGHQQAAGRFRIRAFRLMHRAAMDDGHRRRGGHQAAPDRPRDLHPLQHLRGDLPGRRDHARRPQLRRPRRRLQLLHGLHLAVPDRLDRQLAHDAAWRAPTRSRSSSTWDELPPELTPEQLAAEGVAPRGGGWRRGRAGARRQARGRQPARRRSTRAAFGATVPPWSAAHAYTNLLRAEEPDHGHRRRQRQLHRGRLRQPDAPHRARLRRACRSRCSRASRSASSPPGVDANGRPHVARQYSVASPRNGERPGYNNVSLTVKRVTEDHQGRPVRGVASQLRVRPEGRRHGAGDRPVRPELPDAEPPEVAHRDDLHRHRQRADARDDRVAPAPAQERQVRGRQADAVLRRAHAARSCRTSARCRACRRTSSTSTSRSRARRASRKRYVQDLMRERAADLAPLLGGPERALLRLRAEGDGRGRGAGAARRRRRRRARLGGTIGPALKREGRLHLETY